MINSPIRRKLTERSINKLAGGYTFESVMDDTEGQAILIAQKCKKPDTKSPAHRVFLKIGLEKDTMNSIKKEYKMLRKMEHPHIIKPMDYKKGRVHSKAYRRMVLPYFKHGDLWTLTQNSDGLGENVARVYGLQILEALQFLHEQNIAHRDVKLDNVIVKDDLDVALIDFDLAERRKDVRQVPAKDVTL